MRVAKYQMIEDELKSQILGGTFEYGDRFYSESDLIKRYGVSSITVIHALKNLVSEGYLVREQGKGTFVSRARKQQLVAFSDLEIFNDRTDQERVEVVAFECDRNPHISEKLKLDLDETYHRITRVRRIGEMPYMVHISYIPSRYIKRDISPDYYRSIYRRFREDFGLHLYDEASVETDEVMYPAPDHIAKLLELNDREPCVLQHKATTLADGSVVEYVHGYKRWNFYKIELRSPSSSTAPTMLGR